MLRWRQLQQELLQGWRQLGWQLRVAEWLSHAKHLLLQEVLPPAQHSRTLRL